MIANVDEVLRGARKGEGGSNPLRPEASLLEWIGSNGFIGLPVAIVGTVYWFEWNQFGWVQCKVRSVLIFCS